MNLLVGEKVGFPGKVGHPGGAKGTSQWGEGGVSRKGWSP